MVQQALKLLGFQEVVERRAFTCHVHVLELQCDRLHGGDMLFSKDAITYLQPEALRMDVMSEYASTVKYGTSHSKNGN